MYNHTKTSRVSYYIFQCLLSLSTPMNSKKYGHCNNSQHIVRY